MKRRYPKGKIPAPVTASCRLSEAEAFRLERLAEREGTTISRTLRNLIAAAAAEMAAREKQNAEASKAEARQARRTEHA